MAEDESRFAPLRLKRKEERRLKTGHLWVFSNEVDVVKTPLKGFEPGQPVRIEASNGKSLGTGYVNPHSLIAARLVSRDHRHPFSPSLLVHRIKVALSLRERLYPDPFYRLLYGEGDGLPGLVIDRYGDVLIGQITTSGMERMKGHIEAALTKVVKPAALLWRNDAPVRALEGLDAYVDSALGPMPEDLEVCEHDARFRVSATSGQKTGWFFDQYDNRARLRRLVPEARVLDLFSYVGAWGIQAARYGAQEVLCVDSSAAALEQARANAVLNGVEDRVQMERADAFEVLESLRADSRRFDVVVVDPPAFIKRRKDAKSGLQGYYRLNQLAMQVLAKDGMLVSCSCSQILLPEQLSELIQKGARHTDRMVQIIDRGHQAADHPVHPAIPETDYLKSVTARFTMA